MKDSSPVERPCNVASPEEAKRFEVMALDHLKSRGFRITMTRVQVIRALADSHRALSAYQIHEKIGSSGGRIDVVSVYRILATLQEVGLVHRIGVVEGYYACRSKEPHPHHSEHLVCQDCGCVVELVVPKKAADAVNETATTAGFKLHEMKIEALGTCSHCSA